MFTSSALVTNKPKINDRSKENDAQSNVKINCNGEINESSMSKNIKIHEKVTISIEIKVCKGVTYNKTILSNKVNDKFRHDLPFKKKHKHRGLNQIISKLEFINVKSVY